MVQQQQQSNHAEFEYLPNVIGLVVGLYVASVLIIILYLNLCRCRDYNSVNKEGEGMVVEDNPSSLPQRSCSSHCSTITTAFFTPLTFESTYVAIPGAMWTTILLCITRILRFVFFLVFPCIIVYVQNKGDNWFFYTFWNMDIIVFFYLIASIASIVGLFRNSAVCYELSPATLQVTQWNFWERFLAMAVQIFFNVAATNALLVTVFAYTFLGANFAFNNVSYHLLNTVAFGFEILLSSLVIRFEYFILSLSWLLLYAIYVWCMMVTHRLAGWPYSVLKTDTSSSLFYYGLLYVLLIVSCFVWYIVSKIKVCARGASIAPLLQLQSRVVRPQVYAASVV